MAIFDIIKHEGPNDVLVWKWPGDEITWGTQIIINQTQEALFYKDGQVVDVLGPGRHTLQTANIPILKALINIPFGSQSPFKAEIFFVDKAVLLDVKWGTQRPVAILDPILNIFLPVRANGQFGFRVKDSKKLVVQLVGTVPTLTKEEVINYFRGVILTKSKDHIAAKLIDDKLSILTVSGYLEQFSKDLRDRLSEDFDRFGLEIVNFWINSIDVPDDDPQVLHVKQAMADKAEYRIMGDEAYRVKRTFDVLQDAAKNESPNTSNMMGTGLGFGVGMGAGQGFANLAGGLIGAVTPNVKSLPAPSGMVKCQGCGAEVYSAFKFCTACGGGLVTPNAVCPGCQCEVPVGGKFCGHCGAKLMVTVAAPAPAAGGAPNKG